MTDQFKTATATIIVTPMPKFYEEVGDSQKIDTTEWVKRLNTENEYQELIDLLKANGFTRR